MSDHAPPGWWQAADGHWYPPEQHPEYRPPNPYSAWEPPGAPSAQAPSGAAPLGVMPPPPPFLAASPMVKRQSRSWLVVAIVGATVCVVAATVFVLVGSTGKNTSASTPSATSIAPLGVKPSGFVEIVDSRHEFTLAIPTTWTAAEIRGDISHVGETLMPDDPVIASHLDQVAGNLMPRSAVVLGFLRADLTQPQGFATNMNLIPTTVPADVSLDTIVSQSEKGLENFGATVHSTEATTLANGPATRVEYTLTSAGVDGVQYYVLAKGQVWVLTFSTNNLARNKPEFEQIAQTFVVT